MTTPPRQAVEQVGRLFEPLLQAGDEPLNRLGLDPQHLPGDFRQRGGVHGKPFTARSTPFKVRSSSGSVSIVSELAPSLSASSGRS